MSVRISKALVMVLLCSCALEPAVIYADPPSWAPAHGWRKKHDPNYVGYQGRQWKDDYGVIEGRCNAEAVGAVAGATLGGMIGSRVAKPEDRAVAVVIGVVLGAVVGSEIGKRVEDVDRACVGHTLELAKGKQPVRWVNPQTGLSYVVTPLRDYSDGGVPCREFTAKVTGNGKSSVVKDRACRTGDGTWKIVG